MAIELSLLPSSWTQSATTDRSTTREGCLQMDNILHYNTVKVFIWQRIPPACSKLVMPASCFVCCCCLSKCLYPRAEDSYGDLLLAQQVAVERPQQIAVIITRCGHLLACNAQQGPRPVRYVRLPHQMMAGPWGS